MFAEILQLFLVMRGLCGLKYHGNVTNAALTFADIAVI